MTNEQATARMWLFLDRFWLDFVLCDMKPSWGWGGGGVVGRGCTEAPTHKPTPTTANHDLGVKTSRKTAVG